MRLTARAGQFHLPLTLGAARAPLVATALHAVRASNPLTVVRRGPVRGAERMPTRKALRVTAPLQSVVQRDALVEHETLALPAGCGTGCLLQILQDTAAQMVDLGKALFEQIGGRFLTADTAGAKQSQLAIPERIEALRRI